MGLSLVPVGVNCTPNLSLSNADLQTTGDRSTIELQRDRQYLNVSN